MKLSEEELSVMAGPLETTRVTLTVCEVTPLAAIVMLPVYVFAVKPDMLTDTLTDAGVVPVGVTESHGPPELVAAVAVNASPEVPPTLTGCAAGVACPI